MDWNVFATIIAPIVTLFVGMFLNHYLEGRAKLIAHYGHVSGFRSHQSPNGQILEVNTHSVVIRNTSNAAVHNISVTHNHLPEFSVFPDIRYSVNDLPGGGKEILFPMLTAKEQASITYLYFPPITYNQIRTNIRAENSSVKIINVWQVPTLSKKAIYFVWFMMISGAISWCYVIFIFCKSMLTSQ